MLNSRSDINAIRIATVYRNTRFQKYLPSDMSLLRWLKMSEALARRGYEVDMMVDAASGLNGASANLRYRSLKLVDWSHYHVVKTLFHQGYETLRDRGGADHPFIISKLGSVVGHDDQTQGVHFFNQERIDLFETQREINERSRYITILTKPSLDLWKKEHGRTTNMLMIPTGVDREVPPPGANPYRVRGERVAVYIGNLYEGFQRDINLLWQERLNTLGHLLRARNIKLFFVGPGAIDKLDKNAVTCVGAIDGRRIWDFQYFADVGLVLGQGKVQHNESSKIYYYLRTGLPVVSESSVPNNHIIEEAALGLVADYGDAQMIAEMIETAAHKKWNRASAVDYILNNHTWDHRAQIYDRVIKTELKRD